MPKSRYTERLVVKLEGDEAKTFRGLFEKLAARKVGFTKGPDLTDDERDLVAELYKQTK